MWRASVQLSDHFLDLGGSSFAKGADICLYVPWPRLFRIESNEILYFVRIRITGGREEQLAEERSVKARGPLCE